MSYVTEVENVQDWYACWGDGSVVLIYMFLDFIAFFLFTRCSKSGTFKNFSVPCTRCTWCEHCVEMRINTHK